jgi:hypothetical protein
MLKYIEGLITGFKENLPDSLQEFEKFSFFWKLNPCHPASNQSVLQLP